MSGLLGGGTKPTHTSDTVIAGIDIQTSAYGMCVPLVYGKVRVPPNLIYYNDFTAIPHTTTTSSSGGGKGGGGGGASTNTTYTYTVCALMGLCEGQISGIPQAWTDKVLTTPGAIGLSVYLGTPTQTAFGPVVSRHPGEALGYRRLAYVATGAYDLGDSASLPNHTFEVDALLPFSATIRDANPAAILPDYLTNPFYGVGFKSAKIGNLSQWSNYCIANGLFLSPAYTSQEQASSQVARLAQCSNTALFNSEGVLKAVPYGDAVVTGNGVTFTPNNTPQYALTDDDFLDTGDDPVIVTRGNPADAYNQVSLQYNNRANSYNQDVVVADDQANIELYGLRPMSAVTMSEICDTTVARAVAQLILQRALYIRNTYKFSLGWRFCLLEPMDIVTLTESSGDGLVDVPVRLTLVEENDDGTFNFEAEDYIGGVSSHVAYPTQLAGGYTLNYNTPPGSVNAPIIFDAPGRMADSGFEVWMAVAGTGKNWAGAFVWASTDGTTYQRVGQVHGPSRFGYLQSAFAYGADPDTTDSAVVDFTASGAVLASGSAADADGLNTLCWCDGELFSYQSATLTAASKYTLGTRLRRGVYGTLDASHAAGKGVVRLDGALGRYAYDPAMIGKQVWMKFTSYNIYGAATESIADVPAYTYTIAGPIGAPSDVTGAVATPTADGVMLSWAANPTPNLAQYEVRRGTVWETAQYVGTSLTTQMPVPAVGLGLTTWLVKAVDTSGRASVNAAAMALTVTAPSMPTLTVQVIDNNVLLFWTEAVGTQAIRTYEIRRNNTVIGTKSGLFTNIVETVSGTNTYTVVAIDVGGNYGATGSVATAVSAPPDYVLRTNIQSVFGGTVVNALVDHGAVVMPVDIATSYANHFINGGWATPAAQAASFPIFIEKSLTAGSYTEITDYGQVLNSCKVTVAYAGTIIAGAPVVTCNITVAQDAAFTVGVQTFLGATQALGTSYRYAKVQIAVAGGAGGTDLYRLDSLSIRLDVKLKNDAGTAVWTTNPKVVAFNEPFLDVSAIGLTVMGASTSIVAVTDFLDVPDPTTFKIYLFNSTTGAAPTGPVNVAWSAKGD